MKKVFVFKKIKNVVLIGGGDAMLFAAKLFRDNNLDVSVIMSPRHAEELLPINKNNAKMEFIAQGFNVFVVNKLTHEVFQELSKHGVGSDLAICFGPSWLFSEVVIKSFRLGMINFNGIPIPEYLGGAHYTWQILNDNKSGGCFLQFITQNIDRGDVLRGEIFQIPDYIRTPIEYFEFNFHASKTFLNKAIQDILMGKEFELTEFSKYDYSRTYFPRLNTLKNGYIDWSWDAGYVEKFCLAFDLPYNGAGTFVGDTEVRVHDVRSVSSDLKFHPYASGLVIRKVNKKLYVAAINGLLEISSIYCPTKNHFNIESIKEGMRFTTPAYILDKAKETDRSKLC